MLRLLSLGGCSSFPGRGGRGLGLGSWAGVGQLTGLARGGEGRARLLHLELILEALHLELHLVELVLQLHGLFLILADLFLQVAHLGFSGLRVLLPAVLLKLQTAYQLLLLLLCLHEVHSLAFERLVLPLQLLVPLQADLLQLLHALLGLFQIK